MWHVPDGDLHAYLDGALERVSEEEAERIRRHLETCGECRDRLQAERAVRERADEVLEAGSPGPVTPPPFEEVRRMAEARRSRAGTAAGRPRVRLRRLGWAASVVLALGVGWAVGRQPGADRARAPEVVGAQADEARPDRGRQARGGAIAAATEEAGGEGAATEPAGSRVAQVPEVDSTVGRGALALSADIVEGDEEPTADSAVGAPEERPAEPVAPVADERVAEVAAPVEELPSRPATPLAERELARRRTDPVLRAMRIPGLELVSVEWGLVAPGQEGFRVVQRLPGDTTTVELRFMGLGTTGDAPSTRAEAERQARTLVREPTGGEALPEGMARAATTFGGGWVVIRGRLPEKELLDLLRRLGG